MTGRTTTAAVAAVAATALALRAPHLDPADATAIAIPTALIAALYYGIRIRRWPWDIVCTAIAITWAAAIVTYLAATGALT